MADPVYHVTFSKSLPYIQKRGLDPLSGSLWQQAGTRERYQDQPSVFSFQDPEEALRWASKMKWEFSDDVSGSSDISIVKLRGGDKWEPDPAAGGPDIGKTSMRSLGLVPSSDILEVMSLPTPATVNKEFQRQVPGGRIDEWLKFYGDRLRSLGADEPRPTDQPNLPALLGPPEEPGKKPSSKGGIFRGIGSLMRRRIFPLVQAAQAGWGMLSPEAKAEVEAFLKRPAHELVGMDKPGIEYFKEWLGISPEDLPMDEASRASRAEEQGFGSELYYHGTGADIVAFDLDHPERKDQGWLGTGVYLTDSPALGSVYASLKSYANRDSAKNVMPLRIRLKNPYHATRQEKQTMMLRMHNKSTAEARQIADSWTEDLKKKGHDGVVLQYDPKEVGYANASREIVVFDTSNVKSAFSEFDPAYSRSPELSKAAGGFIDKPLYDNLIAPSRGSFIDKPLYEGAY